MNDLAFDDAGEPVPAVEFDWQALDPADARDFKRELLLEALSDRYQKGKRDTLPAVLAALVDGHHDQQAILARLAGALWKTGLMPLSEAARLAKKSTRQIRRAGADFRFAMSRTHDSKP